MLIECDLVSLMSIDCNVYCEFTCLTSLYVHICSLLEIDFDFSSIQLVDHIWSYVVISDDV